MTFRFFGDPSHGWLRVPIVTAARYLDPEDITVYSYLSKQYVYLEEDVDALAFIRALEKSGEKFVLAGDSMFSSWPSGIRRHDRYSPELFRERLDILNSQKVG